MNARLKVLHEKANVKSVKLLPTTVIGRSTECDLKIAASEVSRLHCRITVQDDAVFIEDLGSANGTFVNDQMLVAHERVAIDPGAKITIGPAQFMVDYVAPTSNTVVVRRTDNNEKPASAPQQADVDVESKPFIFNPMSDTNDESTAEDALLADTVENLFDGRTPPEAVRPALLLKVPETAPKPDVSAPKPAVAISKPAVAAPVAPPIAKPVVAVAPPSVPTAKVVPAKTKPSAPVPSAQPIEQSQTFPLQFEDPRPAKAAQVQPPAKSRDVPPKAAASVVVPTPQPAAAKPADDVLETDESTSVFENVTPFSFTENLESAPSTKTAPKPGKPGGLKSLLSVFNRQAASSSKASPSASEAIAEETQTFNESPIAPTEASPFSFGAVEKEAEGDGKSTEQSGDDDDYQRFLRQF